MPLEVARHVHGALDVVLGDVAAELVEARDGVDVPRHGRTEDVAAHWFIAISVARPRWGPAHVELEPDCAPATLLR